MVINKDSGSMRVTMRMFEYTCGRCLRTYRAPQRTATDGTLVFRDAAGVYVAAVDAIGNPLFDRVDEALNRHAAVGTISDRRRGQVVQRVVGRLSDPAPSGHRYGPDAKPSCAHCGFTQPSWWQSIEPPELVEVELPLLEQDEWQSLSPQDQELRLREEINDAVSA